MTTDDTRLIRRRLANQQLAGPRQRGAAELVAWMGAMQAQDFAGAKWAIGLRTPGLRDADVDALFNAGAILRTHVLRPTWHFVAPADIRWMLMLTAPRVLATCAAYCRKLEIDAATLKKSRAVFDRALRDAAYKTRAELSQLLGRNGVALTGVRLGLVIMAAELNAQICSGPRRGKHSTYALVDERVPHAGTLTRDEALVELVRRYFLSHGPATLRDFSWWSGLPMVDARRGVDALGGALSREITGDRVHWSARTTHVASATDEAHLLPNYDEYLVAYKDRDLVVPPSLKTSGWGSPMAHQIVIQGRLAGGWRRTVSPARVVVDGRSLRPVSAREQRALQGAAKRYSAFLQVPVDCVIR